MALPSHQKSGLPLGRTAPTAHAPASYTWDAAGNRTASHLSSLLPMGEPFGSKPPAHEHDQPYAPSGGQRPREYVTSVSESKRLKRLEKNRESARECRRRKKEHKEKLEAHLSSLEQENLDLRLRLKIGEEAEDVENSEIKEIKNRLNDMVLKGMPEGQILQTMDLLKDRYADYGSVHTSAADFHLEQLSRLLLPTLTTRACMHAVLQSAEAVNTTRQSIRLVGTSDGASSTGGGAHACANAGSGRELTRPRPTPHAVASDTSLAVRGSEVFERAQNRAACDGADGGGASSNACQDPARGSCEGGNVMSVPGGQAVEEEGLTDMWGSLVQVLEATEEQQSAMRGQAAAIAELSRDLEGTTEILHRLKLLLADRNQTLDGEMAEIQRILTPTQTAKFVLWVSKNKACVHMLNELWDKLHGDSAGAS